MYDHDARLDADDLRAEFPRPRKRYVPAAFRSAGHIDERGLDGPDEGPCCVWCDSAIEEEPVRGRYCSEDCADAAVAT